MSIHMSRGGTKQFFMKIFFKRLKLNTFNILIIYSCVYVLCIHYRQHCATPLFNLILNINQKKQWNKEEKMPGGKLEGNEKTEKWAKRRRGEEEGRMTTRVLCCLQSLAGSLVTPLWKQNLNKLFSYKQFPWCLKTVEYTANHSQSFLWGGLYLGEYGGVLFLCFCFL